MEDGNISGHVLIFNTNTDILYFGFFGVLNHNKEKISFLVNKLVEYGRKNSFSKIIGPINIPTAIYGWGFMQEGSETSLYIGKPINLPIYQDLFLHEGFTIRAEELSLEGPVIRIDSKLLNSFDSKNYEVYHPQSWEDVLNFKPRFFELYTNLPSRSVLTPRTQQLYEDYVELIKKYGDLFMIIFLRYKITGNIVGCFFSIPNPFRKNSLAAFIILIDKEHQGKNLGWLLTIYSGKEAWDNNMRYNSSPIEKNEKRSIKIAKKYGQELKRTHLILEYQI